MKKIFFVLVIITLSLVSCNQSVKGTNGVTYKSAVQYNDYIINRQTTLMKNVLDFGKVADQNLDSAETILKKYSLQAEEMINELKGMPPYKGDSALRDAAVHSFSFYKRVFDKDYIDILNIRKKGADITDADVAAANSIVDKIGKEEEVFDKAFHNAQQKYADKNNMKLKENKMQKEVDKVNND